MKIFNSISEFHSDTKTIATLGTFDGVHLGHRQIIGRLAQTAKEQNCESVILTFFPHPRMVLQENAAPMLLNTITEKASLLEQTGLDSLIIHPFDKEFSMLTAEEFVKTILVDGLKIQKIIIGHDHRFGKNRSANIDDLIVFGQRYGFEVEQISAREVNDVAVSSTKIRNALNDGNVTLANEYLGYSYFITGKVIYGKQLGRTIGFPTANIQIQDNYKLVPGKGVYIVESEYDDQRIYGMMNIGNNPTVNGNGLSIEVHFFDFDSDIYGASLKISLLHRIRDEQKFDSVEVLKKQLEQDKQTSVFYINTL